jgi:invasion protein IalB
MFGLFIKIMIKMLKILFILLMSQLFVTQSFAQKFHGQYVDWSLFSNEQGKKNICYISAVPIKKLTNAQNRGEPYIIITKTKGKLPEISVVSGYYYKKNSQVELSFGLKKFNMLTYKSQSWTYSIDDDIEIIKALRNEDSVIAIATSDRNQFSNDTYSLVGFDKAYQALQKLCK